MSLTAGKAILLSSAAGGGYEVSRSLRFNSSDSGFCSRVFSSAGNRQSWTWSGWVKRSSLTGTTARQALFSGRTADSDTGFLEFGFNATTPAGTADTFYCGVWTTYSESTAVFRDVSAWYHIVVSYNGASIKAYVNNVEILSWARTGDLGINSAANHNIGAIDTGSPSRYFNGYLADIHFIDGQALTPSSFTEVSATTGQLIPKQYTGSFGTNGFWLKFSDNSAATATTLGKDYSGNNNNWSCNNLSVITGGPTSVAAASGALPIYNTTDTYGTTKGTGTRTDSNSSSIVLALPMDGSNNGTTFTDESATIKGSGSAKTLTRNGDTKTVTSQSKFYGSSCAFDGTGDFLSHAANTDFQFDTGNLTVELWVYFNSLPGSGVAGLVDTGASVNANRFSIVVYPNGAVYVDSNANLIAGTAGKITAGKWIHIAVCRAGTGSNQTTLYIDGVADKTATVSTNFSDSNLRIGATVDNLYLNGFIQDLRIYKGASKYTGNFNPPSSTQNPTIAAGNDSLVDTPTSYGTDTGAGGEVRGNYATINPLKQGANSSLVNGNLDWTRTSNGYSMGLATIAVSSGKWYWEYTLNGSTNNAIPIGVVPASSTATYPGEDANSVGYNFNGTKVIGTTQTSYGSSLAAGDVVGVAFDATNGTVVFYKNGTSQGTATSALTSGPYCPAVSSWTSGTGSSLNFGQRPWTYAPPANYQPIVDTLLPAPVVAKPSTVMDAKLYTGTGSNQSITGLGFSPDFVWIKSRSTAEDNNVFDAVRGPSSNLYALQTNATSAEGQYGTMGSLDANGFSLTGAGGATNANGTTYVAWTWDAGSSTVTNTQGSITSQVRANASAGFSIVGFAGTGTTSTVGHGLGVAPAFIIGKNRDSGSFAWRVYHSALGGTKTLYLNLTNAAATDNDPWNDTNPTSTTISLLGGGALNRSGNNTILYCFSPVAGYSSFGSYVAGSNPFVYLGFRPRFILFKNTSVSNWDIYDSSRTPYNESNLTLAPNLSGSEYNAGSYGIDLLSNGFKLDDGQNTAGATFVYAAFAESPFQYARAR